jgi:hypothetical protein
MLVYCDFIASKIREALVASKENPWAQIPLTDVGRTQWDLDENGSFRSTKKTINVVDGNGRKYIVTVQEA